MSIRLFTLIGLGAIFESSLGPFGIALGDPRPNIVFIVSDDQRPDTIHALGNEIIHTPILDELVARGSTFTRAVAAYPICHVSRAEILTGCTAFRASQQYPNGPINPQLATLANTFRKEGYITCYTGKWHSDGEPRDRGYSLTSGLLSAGGANHAKGLLRDTQGHAITGYPGWTFKTDAGKTEPEKGIGLTSRTSEYITDGAIQFIERNQTQPFLLHVNFAAPHDPRLMPPGYEGHYDPAQIPLPRNFAPQHPFEHGALQGRDEMLLAKPLDPDDLRRELACYYAVISHMDQQIGRILKSLDTAGILENTLVIFTTDQGLALGSHGLIGKQNLYEHTVGVPLIMAGPGVPQGKRISADCYLRDLFPTFCDLAGIPIPSSVDSRSLKPLLEGSKTRVHDAVIAYFTDTQRMIREDHWKLIVYPQVNRRQLFNLQSDPFEQQDLSADPDQTERIAALHTKLMEWLTHEGDRTLSE